MKGQTKRVKVNASEGNFTDAESRRRSNENMTAVDGFGGAKPDPGPDATYDIQKGSKGDTSISYDEARKREIDGPECQTNSDEINPQALDVQSSPMARPVFALSPTF